MSTYLKTELYIIIYSCISCIKAIVIGFKKLDKSWTQLFGIIHCLLVTVLKKLDQSFLKITTDFVRR